MPGVPIGTWADWDLLLEARSLLERLVCAGNSPPSPTPTSRLVIHSPMFTRAGTETGRKLDSEARCRVSGARPDKVQMKREGGSQAEAYGGCGETEEIGGEEPTCRDARRVTYGTAESLYRTLETHTTLCVKYTGINFYLIG